MIFPVKNQENVQANSAVHNTNTRNKYHLHTPTANLSCFQKSIHYAGIKIFNTSLMQMLNLKHHLLSVC
jgi:hypothetical protein